MVACGRRFHTRLGAWRYTAFVVSVLIVLFVCCKLQQALESDIRERIDPTLRPLRSVLDNKYNGGSIARHSDDEREFQPQPGIAR